MAGGEKDYKKSKDKESTHSAGAEKSKDSCGCRTEGCSKDGAVPLPQVTFATFIMSLNTSALVHLGVMPEPSSGKIQKDIDLAKHTIDTLAMLQEKTQGNLSEEEKALLDNILYDLRIRFVGLKS